MPVARFRLTFVFQFDVIDALAKTYIYPLFENKNGKISFQKNNYPSAGNHCFSYHSENPFQQARTYQYRSKNKTHVSRGLAWLISVRLLKKQGLVFCLYDCHLVSISCKHMVWFFCDYRNKWSRIGRRTNSARHGQCWYESFSPGESALMHYWYRKLFALYNIPKEPYGQALGWLLWFGQFLSFVFFGVVSFIYLPRINKKNNESPQVISHKIFDLHQLTQTGCTPAPVK